jgi:hypothetical protein
MPGAMKDYLSTGTADYTATALTIAPKRIMIESGRLRQDQTDYDDGTTQTVTFSNTPSFIVRLQFPALSKSDAETIWDFYLDANKAKGMARSIKWYHPIDKIYYVVKFANDITRETTTRQTWKSVPDIVFRVFSYYAAT